MVKFGDLVEGVSVQERLDEVTGLSRKVVIESKAGDLRPAHLDQGSETRQDAQAPEQRARRALSPARSAPTSSRRKATTSRPARSSPRCPRETTKVQDITGGLPRVAELFEARKPKDHAIISEIDGEVSFGKDTKGKRKVRHHPDHRRRRGR